MNKTARTMDFSTPRSWDCTHIIRALLLSSFNCNFVFMAPIPPSYHCGHQFRADKLHNFLDLVKSFLPHSAQNWQAAANVHLENYRREAQTAESLRRKFQEISCRTGPTGDPNCPNYVIKAKQINRQLIQMIDASSGGLEAKRSEDGLSDGSDSEDAGAREFANVINEINNAAGNGGGEEVDNEEDADDSGIGIQELVWLRGDEGQPGAAEDGVTAAVAEVAAPGGVAPALARPRGRGPGRSRTLPACAAGVIGPPPARAPPAAVARKGSAADRGVKVDGQISGSSGTEKASDQGCAFCTPINRGRKKTRTGDGDDDDAGGLSALNIMGMMMMQQRSKQSSRDADCTTTRESELALWQEEIAVRREEMMLQLQIQREQESCASADDERHADGDDAKHRWVQSAAEGRHRWWAEDRNQRDKYAERREQRVKWHVNDDGCVYDKDNDDD